MKLEQVREQLPEVARKLAQVTADNPATIALIFAGAVVATRAATNVVRPRTPFEALCLAVVLQAGLSAAAVRAVEAGWLPLKIRDHHNCLVPVWPPGPDDDAACPDA